MTNRVIVLSLLVLALTVALPAPPLVPEIDATTGASALTLLAGAALMIRSRARQ